MTNMTIIAIKTMIDLTSHQVISTINPPPQVFWIGFTLWFKGPINNEVVYGTIELNIYVNENEIILKMWPLVDAFSMRGSCKRA